MTIAGFSPTFRRCVVRFRMREVRFELRVKDRNADTKLVGCSEEYLELNQLAIARGRWFNSNDDGENVIVLADGTAKRLFPYENPIGKTVKMPTVSAVDVYTVIGQTQSRVPSAAIGGSLEARDYNTDAYIPLSTWRRRVGDFVMWRSAGGIEGEVVELSQITVSVDDIDDVDETAAAIEDAAAAISREQGGLRRCRAEGAAAAGRKNARDVQRLAGRDRRHLAAGRWHRYHEHHAGDGHGTDPRNWHPTGAGCRRAGTSSNSSSSRQSCSPATGGLLGVFSGLMCGPHFSDVARAS